MTNRLKEKILKEMLETEEERIIRIVKRECPKYEKDEIRKAYHKIKDDGAIKQKNEVKG